MRCPPATNVSAAGATRRRAFDDCFMHRQNYFRGKKLLKCFFKWKNLSEDFFIHYFLVSNSMGWAIDFIKISYVWNFEVYFFFSFLKSEDFSLAIVFVCLLSAQSAVRFCPAAADLLFLSSPMLCLSVCLSVFIQKKNAYKRGRGKRSFFVRGMKRPERMKQFSNELVALSLSLFFFFSVSMVFVWKLWGY